MNSSYFIRFSCILSLALANTTITFGQVHMPDSGFESSHASLRSAMQMSLTGQIQTGEPEGLSLLRVQILPVGSHRLIYETNPNRFGSFEVAAASSGLYELRIINLQGTVVYSQSVQLPYAHTLIVDLRQNSNLPASGPPISFTRLQHKIPKQALKQYLAAHEAAKKNETNEAILHLQKAIEIDPAYFEAINNLGVQYMRGGRVAEACAAFERATAIDPADSLAETNLAFALLSLRRFAEAEAAARAGLRADGLSVRARFYLAISLLEQNKPRKEVLFHLSKASPQLEPARMLLEHLNREGSK